LINSHRFIRARLRLTVCAHATPRVKSTSTEFDNDNAQEASTSPMRRPMIIDVRGLRLTSSGYVDGPTTTSTGQRVNRKLFDVDEGTPDATLLLPPDASPCTTAPPAATPTHNHVELDFAMLNLPAKNTNKLDSMQLQVRRETVRT
jgi:hypothetical protein